MPPVPHEDEADRRIRDQGHDVETRDGQARATSTTPDSILSRYMPFEELGRGGMGRVYRAYDPILRREVALKEVYPGALSSTPTKRLVVEARAMARLSHPNVVGVYDVSEAANGGVVLVMEYVAGRTLEQWLSKPDRPWQKIVDVFRAAGRGLAAAHEAGLLHRDFKPSNVLVSTADCEPDDQRRAKLDPRVKVTDFGLARATAPQPSVTDASRASDPLVENLTDPRALMGTLLYMAPEQHRAGALTPAADQYAFCVAVWQALCGSVPFSGRGIAAKKHRGPPPWPQRGVPRPIADAICRGLSVKPTERWPSMLALLDALAWDPTFVRRRWLVGLGCVGATTLAAVAWPAGADRVAHCTGAQDQLVGIWGDARRSEVRGAILGIGRDYASGVWDRTGRELDEYARQWAAMHLEACEAATVRRVQSPAVMDLRMACLRRARLELGAVTGELASADPTAVRKAHQLTRGLPSLARCANVDALSQEVEPPAFDRAGLVDDARSRLAEAKAARAAGRYEQAKHKVDQAKAAVADVDYGPVQTEVALAEGHLFDSLGQYAEAKVALRRALRLASSSRQRTQMAEASTKLTYVVGYRQRRTAEGIRYAKIAAGLTARDPRLEAARRNRLGAVLHASGRYEEAEAQHRLALSLREMALGSQHPTLAVSRSNLASALFAQGRYKEAEAEHRRALALLQEALGDEHPDTAMSRDNLAITLAVTGEYEPAETEHRHALQVLENALGPGHPAVEASRSNLASVLYQQGKFEEAEAQTRTALAEREKRLGPHHPGVAESRINLGLSLRALGRYEEAEAEHRQALKLAVEALGPEHPLATTARDNVADALYLRGKYTEAEAIYRQALAAREQALGSKHPELAITCNDLAAALLAQRKYDEAESQNRRALALWHKAFGSDHPDIAMSRTNLARVLLARGRNPEALALAEQAWSRRQRDDIPLGDRAETAFLLARILSQGRRPQGDRLRARGLAQRALGLFEQAGDSHDDEAREVETWLRRGS